ncbi:hypothetical protein GCM10007916_24750 [Psychromonas marina]|uniref:Uncharacterized protein n=1 Tax=Psychromonas marina TaxID=88364 RepID=A0ABQ6E1W9_9GAMM|nr:hypothetical protein [Psychromonas marina]GLS91406.1 hypothetical protein GCM10007916_24750 [Psychromonas marina]
MFQHFIISLVMLAAILSTYSVGLVSAAWALLSFSLLVYYVIDKKTDNSID